MITSNFSTRLLAAQPYGYHYLSEMAVGTFALNTNLHKAHMNNLFYTRMESEYHALQPRIQFSSEPI